MGLSARQRDRLRQLAHEVQEIVGGCLHADGRPMTFAELEEECIEAGDVIGVTTEMKRSHRVLASEASRKAARPV